MSPTVCTAVNSQNRAFSPTTPSSLTIQAGSPANTGKAGAIRGVEDQGYGKPGRFEGLPRTTVISTATKLPRLPHPIAELTATAKA